MDPDRKDDDRSDPFSHSIKMSPLKWLRTILLTPILVPLKVTGLALTLFLIWIVLSISLYGQHEVEIQPLTLGRKISKTIVSFLGRLCFRILGFYNVDIKGQLASKEEAPILVVAPHSTFLDGFVVFWCNFPYIVSRDENLKIPLIGLFLRFAQSLFVCREDPQSRQKTVKTIVERAQNNTEGPQLLIFPEGSTSNRQALVSFKPGAFVPGKPIQPVLVRYQNEVDTVTWTWNQQHGALTILWLTLTQPFSRASLEFLPVYQPSQEEINDPKLFALNVRQVMAKALQVPTSELTFEDVKHKKDL